MVELLVDSLVPVFAGILLGYVAGLRKLVDNENVRTLTTFVTSFAMPCALFTTIVRASHPQLWGEGKVTWVLTVVYVVIYALSYVYARSRKYSAAHSSVLALTLAFPNVAAIGIALLPAAYGNGGLVTDVVAMAIGAATISPVTLAILENASDPQHHLSPLARLGLSLWKSFRRPIVWAPLLGLLIVLLDVAVPSYVDRTLGIFAAATAGTALFLTGLVVSAQRFELTWDVSWSVFGKLVLQPALCLGVARLAGLSVEQTRDVVLISAIPCGFLGVVFAKSFDALPEVASASLIASCGVGIFTLAGWIVFLSYLQ